LHSPYFAATLFSVVFSELTESESVAAPFVTDSMVTRVNLLRFGSGTNAEYPTNPIATVASAEYAVINVCEVGSFMGEGVLEILTLQNL
jgi:hypothetical protein